MMYASWALKILPALVVELVGKIGAPVLALFVDEDGWLPRFLWWFQTPDNSCDGDAAHMERWPRDGWGWTWLRRTAWLFRNSAYGFNIVAIGFKWQAGDFKTVDGDPAVGDRSGVSGLCKWRIVRDGKAVAFQIYYVKHYRIFGTWKCVRAGAGYKIWGDQTGQVFGQHWLYFHPCKGSGRQG